MNVNGFNIQPEDIEWLNGEECKAQQYAAFQKLTQSENERMKGIHANGNWKIAETAIPISNYKTRREGGRKGGGDNAI